MNRGSKESEDRGPTLLSLLLQKAHNGQGSDQLLCQHSLLALPDDIKASLHTENIEEGSKQQWPLHFEAAVQIAHSARSHEDAHAHCTSSLDSGSHCSKHQITQQAIPQINQPM